MNAAKNTCYNKKCLQQKLFGIKFYTKHSVDTDFYLPPRSGPTDAIFETDYNVLEWENRSTLGLNPVKSTNRIEKRSKKKIV